MKILCLIVSITVFIACNQYPKTLDLVTGKNELARGVVFKDSLFHGIVRYYDTLDNYVGFTTFKYGVEDGPATIYRKNIITDSVNFKKGFKNGFGFKYDSHGNLVFKSYFYNDRNVGSAYEYDAKGKVKLYYFVNFEGETIYQMKFEDTSAYVKGSPINAKVYDRIVNGKTKTFLFLYLVTPPDSKSHFEIAVLDSTKKIIISNPVKSTNFYFETELDTIMEGQSHAIVFHRFNKYKRRDDLEISEIK